MEGITECHRERRRFCVPFHDLSLNSHHDHKGDHSYPQRSFLYSEKGFKSL
jgi:hypothetical protein